MKKRKPADSFTCCTVGASYVSFSLLLRILCQLSKYNSLEFVFWKSNIIVEIVLKLLSKLWPSKFTLSRLPCEPLYLPAEMFCDLRKRSFRVKANDVVNKTSRKIFSTVGSQLNIKPLFPDMSVNKFIPDYLTFRIVQNIENIVFFAYHFYSRKINNKKPEHTFILYIPSAWWSRDVASALNDLPITILIGGGNDTINFFVRSILRTLIVLLENSIHNLIKILKIRRHFQNEPLYMVPFIETRLKRIKKIEPVKNAVPGIGTYVYYGLRPDMRNDLNWYWSVDANHMRVVAVWGNEYRLPMNYDFDFIDQVKLKVYSGRTHLTHFKKNIFPVWKPTHRCYVLLLVMIFNLIKTFLKNKRYLSLRALWSYGQMLRLLYGIVWWYDFFITNNIKIWVEDAYDRSTYQRVVAIDMAKGISVLFERCMAYGNSFVEARPAYVSFQSGAYSLKQIENTDKVVQKVVVGYYLDQMDNGILEKQRKYLRETLHKLDAYNDGPLVLVCDEGGTIYGADKVFYFYRELLKDVQQKGEYRLLLKPKRKVIFQELPSDIIDSLKILIQRKKCFILEPSTTITLAASVVDLVISVPSTAMFTAITLGKKTIVFNPYYTMKGIFYDQGLENKCIFEDMLILLDSLHKYLRGQFSGLGDCTAVHEIIDPYRDGKAGERIASFLKYFLEYYSQSKDREVAIKNAFEAVDNDHKIFDYKKLIRT